ncbi:unnamed protein product, partial [Didymodactylos carnosus]
MFLLFAFLWLTSTVLCLIDNKSYRPSAAELSNPSIYPKRSFYGIKSVQPDNWKIDDLTGNGVGGVALNFPWSDFQPTGKRKPCSSDEIEYDEYCFKPAHEALTKLYTDRQLMITAVLIIPPLWARKQNTDCKQANQNFCAPDNADDFGRFAGFLASRYNGKNNVGRICEFVIMNEVNAAEWYNTGCGNGKACNIDNWVKNYGNVYIAAYDQIKKHQPQAPVLISLEHHFDSVFDQHINARSPIMSGRTFLTKLAPQLGARNWSVAFHSYPPSLL